ncbi:hypothetical protein LDENG_00094050 [Lucifuga dentata]|nr:hypothetical protein LDENG_00094050 [Lucifuga dentata]
MKDFSLALGIPMNCIFPVKNYSCEISLDEDMDTLILSALRGMLDFGKTFSTKSIVHKTCSVNRYNKTKC